MRGFVCIDSVHRPTAYICSIHRVLVLIGDPVLLPVSECVCVCDCVQAVGDVMLTGGEDGAVCLWTI